MTAIQLNLSLDKSFVTDQILVLRRGDYGYQEFDATIADFIPTGWDCRFKGINNAGESVISEVEVTTSGSDSVAHLGFKSNAGSEVGRYQRAYLEFSKEVDDEMQIVSTNNFIVTVIGDVDYSEEQANETVNFYNTMVSTIEEHFNQTLTEIIDYRDDGIVEIQNILDGLVTTATATKDSVAEALAEFTAYLNTQETLWTENYEAKQAEIILIVNQLAESLQLKSDLENALTESAELNAALQTKLDEAMTTWEGLEERKAEVEHATEVALFAGESATASKNATEVVRTNTENLRATLQAWLTNSNSQLASATQQITSMLEAIDTGEIITREEFNEIMATVQMNVPEFMRKIYGIKINTNDGSDAGVVRTDDSADWVVYAGFDGETPRNDADAAMRDFISKPYKDAIGNWYVDIKRHYTDIRKTESGTFIKRISLYPYPGWTLSPKFKNPTTGKLLDHISIGCFKASSESSRMISKPGKYPTNWTSIVSFRTQAKANNNLAPGHQQMDFHTRMVITNIVQIVTGTLNPQEKVLSDADVHGTAIKALRGLISESYDGVQPSRLEYEADGTTVKATNRIIFPDNTNTRKYRVGQSFSGAGGTRTITKLSWTSNPITSAKELVVWVDGAPYKTAATTAHYCQGWPTGFTKDIAATIGTKTTYRIKTDATIEPLVDGDGNDLPVNGTNTVTNREILYNDGTQPFSFYGMENLWGDLWEWVDDLNINTLEDGTQEIWTTDGGDSNAFASNLFAAPYRKLGYGAKTSESWIKDVGLDPDSPLLNLPIQTATNGTESTYYGDYYYRSTAVAPHVARVGGYFDNGTNDGLSCWNLNNTTSGTHANIGTRLVKMASV
ncbi:hypothetical protein EQG49_12885 [Periweissella cryptocerci]|uniref:Uncharacterized protein n=1 Tax=Periweissella cryptocerci TaxID=2506420 RepID=A0A4P6YWQ1_9LACO|nr:hypothetical protein [Periweissella cryptocerci]QBO37292.1 hypothetical protein EQG49_12885 [Periweissella cryptocerci]